MKYFYSNNSRTTEVIYLSRGGRLILYPPIHGSWPTNVIYQPIITDERCFGGGELAVTQCYSILLAEMLTVNLGNLVLHS